MKNIPKDYEMYNERGKKEAKDKKIESSEKI